MSSSPSGLDLLAELEAAPLPSQPDDLIWSILNEQFCSFKVKTRAPEKQALCRNENNLTGLCNKSSCPLANSNYATVRRDGEKLALCVKRPEHQHEPRKIWEKIYLSDTKTEKAKAVILKTLSGQTPFVRDKCLARYERLVEIKQKESRLEKHPERAPIVETIKSKHEKKERGRERRALEVSRLEQSIEKELLRRLHTGVYGDMYNLDQKEFEKVIEEGTKEMEFVPDEEEESEPEYEYELEEYDDEEELLEEECIEDIKPPPARPPKRRTPVVEIEYEEEGQRKKITHS
jgi:protein MAK16